MLWLDIEGTGYWKDQAYNRNFFSGLISGAASAGVNLGVYTSASQWNPIMGSFTAGSGFPLWYAHCTLRHNFIDNLSVSAGLHRALDQMMGI